MKYLSVVLALIGWLVFIACWSYIWTAVKLLTQNSMTKHKKVCDLCFRDIKKWHELNGIKPKEQAKKELSDE